MDKNTQVIELRIKELSDLVLIDKKDSIPPKTIDQTSIDYIFEQANTPILKEKVKLVVKSDESVTEEHKKLTESILQAYFSYKISSSSLEMDLNFAAGRRAALASVTFLIFWLGLIYVISLFENESAKAFFGQAALVTFWVSIWIPFQIFLFAWIPIRHQRKLYKNLSKIEVEFV